MIESFKGRRANGERGQILAIVAVMLGPILFCMCGFVVDMGRVYISYQQLVASTDAAALAGGEAMGQPGATTSTITTAITTYSSSTLSGTTGVNPSGVMTGLSLSPYVGCITGLSPSIPCYGAGSYNAVQVTQSGSVPMTFAKFFGSGPVSLSVTSTATMSGAAATPYNVAIIVDTTESMTQTDSGSDCNSERITCALNGIATLLGELAPCPSGGSCSISGNVATNAVDRVALFTFPNMTTATTSDDTTCPTSNPTTEKAYTFPTSTLGTSETINPTFTPSTKGATAVTMTYEVTNGLGDSNGYLSDYRSSDTSTTLNASSPLAIAVGSSGVSKCLGLGAPGGAGTFYAGVIYAATNSLLAEQYANPTAQNVMILISDGDAGSSQSQMAGGSGAPGTYTGTGAINATSGGTYPSWNNECAQAVTAAAAAAGKGIRVYSVAYGAESSGCSTDSPAITPCQTMKNIASNPGYFFSDYAQSGSGVDKTCAGSGAATTSINQIFQDIYYSLGHARLVSNSAPPGGNATWTAE